ncbi:MAG TPA: hypothetical protein VMV10_12620 [Pirellulales bacterium]|nr:hypothetical protein [Pirellulales bacterium]
MAEVVNAYRPATDSPFTKLLLIADLGFQRFIADVWIVSLVLGLCSVLASGLFFRDAPSEGLGSSAPARRRSQFSLKGFFVLLTVIAIWLGVTVNQAREQRAAVRAIEALGGTVVYDWRLRYEYSEKYGFAFSIDRDDDPPGPAWLRRLVGDDFFQNVEVVFFEAPETNALKAIPHLQQLRTLRILGPLYDPYHRSELSAAARAEFKASLPVCRDW